MYLSLRRLGLSADTLYRRLRLQPMNMSAVPTGVVSQRLADQGVRVFELDSEQDPTGVVSAGYYATR